ncbi:MULTISPECIES: hypothetical protein [unclassified Mesorhizobium]|uniref:hypothetical protein n=1 Tax=unclassified Mesorhizobium TaxID=325217 RepID=UPI003336F439
MMVLIVLVPLIEGEEERFCFRLAAEAARGSPAAAVAIRPANKTSRRDPPTEKSPSLFIMSIHVL